MSHEKILATAGARLKLDPPYWDAILSRAKADPREIDTAVWAINRIIQRGEVATGSRVAAEIATGRERKAAKAATAAAAAAEASRQAEADLIDRLAREQDQAAAARASRHAAMRASRRDEWAECARAVLASRCDRISQRVRDIIESSLARGVPDTAALLIRYAAELDGGIDTPSPDR